MQNKQVITRAIKKVMQKEKQKLQKEELKINWKYS